MSRAGLMNAQESRALRERMEILSGDRGDKNKRAVRMAEFNKVVAMIVGLKGATASLGEPTSALAAGVPTMEEFNALVTDVHAIYTVIGQMLADRT